MIYNSRGLNAKKVSETNIKLNKTVPKKLSHPFNPKMSAKLSLNKCFATMALKEVNPLNYFS